MRLQKGQFGEKKGGKFYFFYVNFHANICGKASHFSFDFETKK